MAEADGQYSHCSGCADCCDLPIDIPARLERPFASAGKAAEFEMVSYLPHADCAALRINGEHAPRWKICPLRPGGGYRFVSLDSSVLLC